MGDTVCLWINRLFSKICVFLHTLTLSCPSSLSQALVTRHNNVVPAIAKGVEEYKRNLREEVSPGFISGAASDLSEKGSPLKGRMYCEDIQLQTCRLNIASIAHKSAGFHLKRQHWYCDLD